MVAQRKQGRADVGLGRAGEGGRGARGGGFFFCSGRSVCWWWAHVIHVGGGWIDVLRPWRQPLAVHVTLEACR